MNIIVCVKQVLDPEMPASAFKVDPGTKRVVESQGTPPVLNGFDENAVEAALRIKDAVGANVTALSMGRSFVMDVVKKPLSMGADDLVLLEDDAFHDLDSYATATVLSAAIRKIGDFDLILAGRQASDWDNAQVPLGVAEMLDLPCLTVAQKGRRGRRDSIRPTGRPRRLPGAGGRPARPGDRHQRARRASIRDPAGNHGGGTQDPPPSGARQTSALTLRRSPRRSSSPTSTSPRPIAPSRSSRARTTPTQAASSPLSSEKTSSSKSNIH